MVAAKVGSIEQTHHPNGVQSLSGIKNATSKTMEAPKGTDEKVPSYLAGFAPLLEQPICTGRKMKIIHIGAGFAGVGSAVHIMEHIPDAEFVMYDKNKDFGGVWYSNRYANVACDVPSHTYQFSFAENTQWSAFYASGKEIHGYITKVVDYYNLRPLMKLSHEVTSARWHKDKGKWEVTVFSLNDGKTIVDWADVVMYGPGLLSKFRWPDVPNRDVYRGKITHSANWDVEVTESEPGWTWEDKRVAVIGVGSSAIQIMPYVQKRCKSVHNFARTRTWLSSVFASKLLDQLEPGVSNHKFTAEERENLKDLDRYKQFRLEIERDLGSAHKITEQNTPEQNNIRRDIEAMMRHQLRERPEIAEALIPDFPVACKRLTPGPGYLDCLVKDNCHFVTTGIKEFTEKGIRTVDGEELEFDFIVCATGFDTTSVPGFPIIGENGVNLQDIWAEDPKQYLAVGVPNMPNFFNIMTAQSAVASGSLLVVMEAQIAYVTKAIQKLSREGYKSITVKPTAVEAWLKYVDDYMDRTVYTGNCKSWYKGGRYGKAKVRTLWPGAASHAYLALKEPRWEDWDYEPHEDYAGSMAWLGNGDIPASLDKAFFYEELRAAKKDCTSFT